MRVNRVWFIAGADAVGLAEQNVAVLQEQVNAYSHLSISLALGEVETSGSRR